MNKVNLNKLADYLLSGNLKASFDMENFSENDELAVVKDAVDCGSVGCAVGHGPYAGIPKNKGEGWSDYSERVFGIGQLSEEWEFCFSGRWRYTDNTAKGAGLRIKLLIKEGIPLGYAKQMTGFRPLSYLK